jgi:transposase
MARFDLTDFEWSVIEPLLATKVRGVMRVDDRRVLNGIFWRLRTGAPWADIPARYGPRTACVNRLVAGAARVTGHGYWRPCQQLTGATCR